MSDFPRCTTCGLVVEQDEGDEHVCPPGFLTRPKRPVAPRHVYRMDQLEVGQLVVQWWGRDNPLGVSWGLVESVEDDVAYLRGQKSGFAVWHVYADDFSDECGPYMAVLQNAPPKPELQWPTRPGSVVTAKVRDHVKPRQACLFFRGNFGWLDGVGNGWDARKLDLVEIVYDAGKKEDK